MREPRRHADGTTHGGPPGADRGGRQPGTSGEVADLTRVAYFFFRLVISSSAFLAAAWARALSCTN
jgi:hypothetical protein